MSNEPGLETPVNHGKAVPSWLLMMVPIVVVGGFIVMVAYNPSTALPPTPPPPGPTTPIAPTPVPQTPVEKPSFSQISQADQIRMREIMTGVIQNTIQVTPAIKSELSSILAKYNATEAEMREFATYGPSLSVNYQRLFYTDALQAVSTGYPIKSSERLILEKEALSRGLMTSERFAANDKMMIQIAGHQPIVGSDGQQGIFTTEIINGVLNNLDSAGARLKSLFSP